MPVALAAVVLDAGFLALSFFAAVFLTASFFALAVVLCLGFVAASFAVVVFAVGLLSFSSPGMRSGSMGAGWIRY